MRKNHLVVTIGYHRFAMPVYAMEDVSRLLNMLANAPVVNYENMLSGEDSPDMSIQFAHIPEAEEALGLLAKELSNKRTEIYRLQTELNVAKAQIDNVANVVK